MENNFYHFSEILLASVIILFWLAFFTAIIIFIYKSIKEVMSTNSASVLAYNARDEEYALAMEAAEE